MASNPMHDLDELVRLAGEHAHRIILEHHQDLSPAFLFVTGGGEVHVLVVADCVGNWDDRRIKDDVADRMRHLMRQRGAVAYSYLSEAWMAIRAAGEPMPDNVRDLPDRIEVVTCIAHDDKGNGRSKAWRMIRDAAGMVTQLIEDEPFGEGARGITAGRFSNLLEGRA